MTPHIHELYQPELLELGTLPKPGDRKEAVITSIECDKLKNFLTKEVLEKSWPTESWDRTYLQITCQYDGGVDKSILMGKPKGTSVSPRSKLAKWKKAYGDWPTVGQKVYLLADGNGYYQFHLT